METQTNQQNRIQPTQQSQNESTNSDENTEALKLRIRVLEEENMKHKLVIAKLITNDIPAAHRPAESGVNDRIDYQAKPMAQHEADYLNALLAKSYVGLGALVEWISFLQINKLKGRPLGEDVKQLIDTFLLGAVNGQIVSLDDLRKQLTDIHALFQPISQQEQDALKSDITKDTEHLFRKKDDATDDN